MEQQSLSKILSDWLVCYQQNSDFEKNADESKYSSARHIIANNKSFSVNGISPIK